MENITIRNTNESEEARKQVCLEQLAQDRSRLLMRWPFIGSVIMRMELIPVRDDRLSTACTDGDNIFVDINFYAKLTQDERLFVLAHEVWHSVFLHFARRQNREMERFNIAADLEIHFALEDEKLKEPFVLPHDRLWKGLSAEEIYEKLSSKEIKTNPVGEKNTAGGSGGLSVPGKGGGKKQQAGTGEKKQPRDSNGHGSVFGDGQSSFDKHIYKGDALPEQPAAPADGAQELENEIVIDKDYNPSISGESVERSRSRTIAAAQQIERTQGTLPAGIASILEKLSKPRLPWQEMLKQFVTSCYGGKRRWLPPARRHVWQDLYLPSMRDEVLKAVVAVDTSGSTANDLPIFFSELVSLMKSFGKFELDVIQCDAEIQGTEHYTEANVPPPNKKWDVKGFGGTDFRPVFKYIQENMREQPDVLLFFTDGYGDAPKNRPPYPVMWVLTEDGRQPATWGRVAHFKK